MHRLEGKRYLLIRVPQPLCTSADLRATAAFQLMRTGTDIIHPGLARWMTFWAEESDLYSERGALRRGRSRSATTLNDLMAHLADASDTERAVLHYLILQVEILQGPTLFAWLRHVHLTRLQAFLLFHRIWDALSALHSRGLVHGEFSSRTVIMGDEPKVIGYGQRTLKGFSVDASADLRALGLLLVQLTENVCASEQKDACLVELKLANQLLSCSDQFSMADVGKSPHFCAWRKSVFDSSQQASS